MTTTIRNLDEANFRELKAKAAREGKSLGEAVNEAIQVYLHEPVRIKTRSILDLQPIEFPPGNENLSREIDPVLYGEE